jgi:integrase
MASLRMETTGKGIGWRLQFYNLEKKKRSIWLGAIPKHDAESWRVHVEHLAASQTSGTVVQLHTSRWIAELTKPMRAKLATAGLIDIPKSDDLPWTITQLCDTYIASRKSIADRTKTKLEQVKSGLIEHFGADRELLTITEADAESWREWLAAKSNKRNAKTSAIADATVRRRTGIAKQFIRFAIKSKKLKTNPFEHLASGNRANDERQFFVDRAITATLLDFAPCAEWRAIIALSRFGGIRCPSETMNLHWGDVDFVNSRIVIRENKTKSRVCPMFPELRPHLEDLIRSYETRPSPHDLVIPNKRGSESYMRTMLLKIMKRSGLTPWPRLFHNMRATRETELLSQFPIKDVCDWIGNSAAVAMKHYAMRMTSSFEAAIRGSTGGSIAPQNQTEPHGSLSNGQERSMVTRKPRKPNKKGRFPNEIGPICNASNRRRGTRTTPENPGISEVS